MKTWKELRETLPRKINRLPTGRLNIISRADRSRLADHARLELEARATRRQRAFVLGLGRALILGGPREVAP